MADQNSRGFRKFMLDPKSSVMTYIADNIPPEHMSHQQGSNGRLQNDPMNGQQPNVQDPNRLQQNQILNQNPQNQSQDSLMRPPLPNRPSQSNSPSLSPRPGYAQPVQSSQMPMNTPYIASNMSHANQGLNGYSGAQTHLPGVQSMSNIPMSQENMSQQGLQSQYSSLQNERPSIASVGQGPPPPGARRRNSPQSAPRLYHRMMLDFEITKKSFFAARSRKTTSLNNKRLPKAPTNNIIEHNVQEMTSTAYELESSSRRVWALRYEHSWEFEGYSDAGHQAVFSKWQAEYEMWADTVLDIQDGQILADAANPSKYGNMSMNRDAEEWDSQSRQARPGYQELNDEKRHHSPSMPQEQMPPHMSQQMSPQPQMPPQQQMPQLQNLSMGQPISPPQSIQNIQPPQSMPPGAYPQNVPLGEQNMPPQQQRQQSPRPPQMPMAQSPPPAMQNGPNLQPDQYNGPPNMLNTSNNSPAPNMQQPPNTQQPLQQNARPGQIPNIQQAQPRPPQQYPPQTQPGLPSGPAPNMHQQQQSNPGANQQGPLAPRNGMPNMGPRQNPSPRPGSQMPSSLQAGGPMLGVGRA